MDVFKASERLMGMDDAAWERHANPVSVMARFSGLPLIVLAIWSRTCLGWWSIVPLLLALFWTWLNPRLLQLAFWTVLCGLAMTILPKVWFVDRMAWMYHDMQG